MSKSVKKKSSRSVPPPVLDDSRVIAYAIIERPVKYSGRSNLLINGKEVGRVPRLVIARSFREKQFLLLHCSRSWAVLGSMGGFRSGSEAKRRAERIYPGISAAWNTSAVTAREARTYRNAMWKGQECSFCGRLPYEIQSMVQGRNAKICDICVHACYGLLSESSD